MIVRRSLTTLTFALILIVRVPKTSAESSDASPEFYFTEQPVDEVLSEGKEQSLYCTISSPGLPGVRYTWYKSDTFKGQSSVIEGKLMPIAGQEASILYFSSIHRSDTGYYHCMVETDLYKIFSNTAFVQVNYFTRPPSPQTNPVSIANNQEVEYLPCNTPESSPIVDVMWMKDSLQIENPRMFVFPGDKTSATGTFIARGTLMIINSVMAEDAGRYECWTSEDGETPILLSAYEVTTTSGVNSIDRPPAFVYKSYEEENNEVDIESGGTVTLVCAGTGWPQPSYEWYRIGENGAADEEIRGSDSLQLEDYDRRLVASNIRGSITYKCVMSNEHTVNGRPRQNNRPSFFYVYTFEDESDYNIDILEEPKLNHILKPNLYQPFILHCSVRNTGQIQILWLKNGQKLDYNARIRTEDAGDDPEVTSRNLVFETTNESDLGVYQCVIFNSERLKTRTAYVTLETDTLPYSVPQREPSYTFLDGEFSVDDAEEECNSREGHLVSILTASENKAVQDLLVNNNVDSAWIGLTREVPKPEGAWLWTISADVPTAFSNWEQDKPDNKYGRQEYAVMVGSSGEWLDVDKSSRRPAVCKHYNVVCPSIDLFFAGRVRARGWESVGATYEVGEKVDVYCRFQGDRELSASRRTVTCEHNRKFNPPSLSECPEVPSSSVSPHMSSLLFGLLVALSLRTF